MRELVIKKCKKCNAIMKVMKDCTCIDCGIKCCGEGMIELKPNAVDASFEKHVPTYEVKHDNLVVHVKHVMEDEHYIEWIAFVNEHGEEFVYFKPNEECNAVFKYTKGILYSYCNKHYLWMTEVK